MTTAPSHSASIRTLVEQATGISDFQRRVYLALLDVPAGSTITYGELARRCHCRSAQAIGQALRRNPFAPLVPCHRVVKADGTPGGYFGSSSPDSIQTKLQLLAAEQKA